MSTRNVPSRPPPDQASLREAAMNYLARYATTESGLRMVLHRRIDRWAREASDENADREGHAVAAKAAVPAIVARMVELGLVNDAAFAENRARGLARGGRSRAAITARLMAKGIDREQARSALPEDDGGELVSALILARKRRLGPFRAPLDAGRDRERRDKEMGLLARAGFPRDIAIAALAMEAGEAEEVIRAAMA
jgi:regulatory protein